ncbi:MAG: hypothetical protein HY353_00820 [Candidatus Omnitrophica bacterium]|nr:hypothetical protein [Candidatus Omnitrophota bacterium]
MSIPIATYLTVPNWIVFVFLDRWLFPLVVAYLTALYWISLVYLRRGFLHLKTGRGSEPVFLWVSGTLVASLLVGLLGGQTLGAQRLGLGGWEAQLIPKSLVWHFFMTCWFILEALCVWYVLQFHDLLQLSWRAGVQVAAPRRDRARGWLLALGLSATLVLYGCYHYQTLLVFKQSHLSGVHFLALMRFYRLLAGMGFIVIEWVAVVLLVRGYRMLKRRAG